MQRLMIVILGGDWAGNVYGNSGCPSTCVGKHIISHIVLRYQQIIIDYVNYNPWAFQNAYFDFGAIRVYT